MLSAAFPAMLCGRDHMATESGFSLGKDRSMRSIFFSAGRWSLVVLLVLAGSGGRTLEAASLRWKFKPGETLRYAMDQKTVTTAKFPGGQELKNTLSQTIALRWDVKSVSPDGTADLVQTIEQVVDRADGPLGKYEYDSKVGKEPEGPIAASRVPLFKALIGAPIAFKISAQGEPSEVKVPEKLTQSLKEAGPAAAAAGQLFSEEGLKSLILQTTLIVPRDDLAPGKTWSRQTKEAMPGVGTMSLDTTFTYQGPDPKTGLEIIAQLTKVDLQPPPDAKDNFPLKVKSQDSKGVVHFDSAAGHFIDSQSKEKIEISAMVNNMEIIQLTETETARKLVNEGTPK
jgi:hypothetical protein